MTVTEELSQIKSDFLYVKDNYGVLVEWSNAAEIYLIQLLDAPNKRTAVNIYWEILESIFTAGYDSKGSDRKGQKLPLESDPKLRDIAERQCLLDD
jgi:hypothetical protein